MTRTEPTWSREDAITYRHRASGARIIKMADNTWSVSTGPLENHEIGLAKWLSHKHRTLASAKMAASFYWRQLRAA